MTAHGFKRTQMRELYGALAHLKQSEQVALAMAHAHDASMLEHRIEQDLGTVAAYPSLGKTDLVDDKRTKLPVSVDIADLKSTAEFARALADQDALLVSKRTDLGFRYLEREISPLRGSGLERRSMDLLLLNEDGTPILGELKRGPDSLPYYALIQLLVHLVELSSASQRRRLVALGVPPDKRNARMDLYLLAYGAPHVTHHKASLKATKEISAQLMRPGGALTTHVRRIAYLQASQNGSGHALEFAARFVAE